MIFINFMILRYIVKSVIFPGGTFLMNVIMKNEFGKYLKNFIKITTIEFFNLKKIINFHRVYAKRFYNKLKDFSQEINLLKSVYQKSFRSYNLKNTYECNNLNIYNQLIKKN